MEFHEAALRAGHEEKDPNGARVIALRPMIVCCAFAAELYLKSLIQEKSRSHDLDTLFKKLNAPTRKKIEESYEEKTGRDHRTLGHDLEKLANAFAEWRYVFENDGQQIHTNLLTAFTKSLLEIAKSTNPNWAAEERHTYQIKRLLAAETEPSMTVFNLGGGALLHVTDGTGGKLNTPEA
jgi:HEPN domain-containing protein